MNKTAAKYHGDTNVAQPLTGRQSPRKDEDRMNDNERRCNTCESGGVPCNCYLEGVMVGYDRGRIEGFDAGKKSREDAYKAAITRLKENIRQQITFQDAVDIGYMDAVYVSTITTKDGRQVEQTTYPTIFPIHVAVELLYKTVRTHAHWAVTESMHLSGTVPPRQDQHGESLLPEVGGILKYSLDEDDAVEHYFRVTGWHYEDGTNNTIIRLETEPCSIPE